MSKKLNQRHVTFFPKKKQEEKHYISREHTSTRCKFRAKAKLETRSATYLYERAEKSLPDTDFESADCRHSIHAAPIASDVFHLWARSVSPAALLCPEVAIATALRPLLEPILELRSRSRAAAKAAAFAAALSFGADVGRIGVVSVGFWKLENVCNLADLRSSNDVSRLRSLLVCGTIVSVPEALAAIMANAIATGGEAKAAAQPGDIIEIPACVQNIEQKYHHELRDMKVLLLQWGIPMLY
jgi:hypothetical protein